MATKNLKMLRSPLMITVSVAVAGLALLLLGGGDSSDGARPSLAQAGFTQASDRATGHARYAFTYESDTAVKMGVAGRIKGRTRLSGELELHTYSAQTGLRLTDIDTAEIEVNGKSLLADTATAEALLLGPEAVLERDSKGRLQGIAFSGEVSSAAQNVLQTLAAEAQITVRSEPTWTAVELTPQGEVESLYQRTGDGTVIRDRVRYLSLRTTGKPTQEGQIDSKMVAQYLKGELKAMTHDESIKVLDEEGTPQVTVRTRLTLSRITSVSERAMPLVGDFRGLRTVAHSEDVARAMLIARVDGMTFDKLTEDLFSFGNSGHMPDHNRWLWRTTGLLKLHPERCADLIPMFQEPTLNGKSRNLVLDLLVSAGHSQAQSALRILVDSPTSRQEGHHDLQIQRLGWLDHPEPETINYLSERHAEEEGHLRMATAYALGSSAGKAIRQGDEEARGAYETLHAELKAADDSETQKHLLAAIGNAELADSTPTLARYAGDEVPSVREAAARALRAPQTPGNEHILNDLLRDENRLVRQSAIRTLAGYELNADHVHTLMDLVRTRVLTQRDYPGLIDLAVKHRMLRDELQGLAQEMLTQAPRDARLVLRIKGLIDADG